MTQHIYDAANQLAREGKKPSVALIKSRLTKPSSMRDIIEVLKVWQFDPNSPVTTKSTSNAVQAVPQQDTQQQIVTAIAPLQHEITSLNNEVSQLKSELQALKKVLLTD